jgi:hypothetical protein
MLTKEISEVEKELELEFESKYPLDSLDYIKRKDKLIHLRAKLSTLKSAQAKFDKFMEDLKEIKLVNPLDFAEKYFNECKEKEQKGFFYSDFVMAIRDEILKRIDELSSKQEEKE